MNVHFNTRSSVKINYLPKSNKPSKTLSPIIEYEAGPPKRIKPDWTYVARGTNGRLEFRKSTGRFVSPNFTYCCEPEYSVHSSHPRRPDCPCDDYCCSPAQRHSHRSQRSARIDKLEQELAELRRRASHASSSRKHKYPFHRSHSPAPTYSSTTSSISSDSDPGDYSRRRPPFRPSSPPCIDCETPTEMSCCPSPPLYNSWRSWRRPPSRERVRGHRRQNSWEEIPIYDPYLGVGIVRSPRP